MKRVNLKIALATFLVSALCLSSASAAIGGYSQDFEALDQSASNALSSDGWIVGANVFSPDGESFLFNYFSFPAPNGGSAFSAIVDDQGGLAQGSNQLSVYNDYNNTAAHGAGYRVEAFVFQEYSISAADTGINWGLSFDALQGNIDSDSTARAYVQVLDPNSGFSQTDFAFIDTTAVGFSWSSFELSVFIDEDQIGQLLQFGFITTASNFESSGVFYDNIEFAAVPVPVPGALLLMLSALGGLSTLRRRG